MYINIANIIIKVNNNYQFINAIANDFIIDDPDYYDFEVRVTQEEIEHENFDNLNVPISYLESVAIHRAISKHLTSFNALIIHGASFKVDNNGFIISAKSGTGKTTHSLLLQKYLGDRFQWINGDKPIVRFINNDPIVFGTPFQGKEHYGNNISAPCKALIFLERSEKNYVTKLDKRVVFRYLSLALVIEQNPKYVDMFFDLVNKFIESVDFYILHCNMESDAAICSYENIISKY